MRNQHSTIEAILTARFGEVEVAVGRKFNCAPYCRSMQRVTPASKCVAAENFPLREKAASLLFSVRPLSVPAYLTEPFVGPSVGCCQKRIWIGNLWRKAPSFQIIFLSELFQLGIVHGGGAHARLFHTHRGRTKTVKPFSPPPPRWTPTKQNKSGER